MGVSDEDGRYGAEAHLCEPCAEGFHGDCLGYPQAALGSCLCSCPDASYGRSRQLIRLPDVPLRPLSLRRRVQRRVEDVRRWVRMKRIVWSGEWDLWRQRHG